MLSLIPFSLTFTFWGNPERANVRCLALSHPNVNYNFFLYVYILFLDIYFYHFFSPIFGLVPMVFLMMHIECYRSGLSVSMLDIVYVHGHRAERAYITGTFFMIFVFYFLCITFMWFFFHMESGNIFKRSYYANRPDVKFCQQSLYYIFWSHIPKPCIFHVHTIDWTQMKITIIMFFFSSNFFCLYFLSSLDLLLACTFVLQFMILSHFGLRVVNGLFNAYSHGHFDIF